MKQIKILVIPSDYIGGVGEYRSIKPHLYLRNKYPKEFLIDIARPGLSMADYSAFEKYDIIHYHKYLDTFEDTKTHVDNLTAMGKVMIMDIDDHWMLGMQHPNFKSYRRNKTDKLIIDNLRSAKNITTTTEFFAKEISRINKNVFVIENGIDSKSDHFTPKPVKSKRIRIGWLGGSTHKEDLEILRNNINKLMVSDLKDKVQMVLCGFDLRGSVTEIDKQTGQPYKRPILPTETTWYEYEKIFTNNYTTISKEYKEHLLKFTREEFPGVDNEPYRRIFTKQITSYGEGYNHIDIVLAPLVDSEFNLCKSQLKAIECGMHKKPLIAQNFGPYKIDLINAFEKGGTYNYNANALLVDKPGNKGDWFKYIKKLIEDPKLMESLSTNLNKTIMKKYDLEVLTEKRKKYYLSLLK